MKKIINKIQVLVQLVFSYIRSFFYRHIQRRRLNQMGEKTLDFLLRYLFIHDFCIESFNYSDTLIYKELVEDYYRLVDDGFNGTFRLYLYYAALKLIELVPNNTEFSIDEIILAEKDIPEPKREEWEPTAP